MFLLLVRRLDEESHIWGEWQPHSAYPTQEAVEDIKRQLSISDIITDYKEPT